MESINYMLRFRKISGTPYQRGRQIGRFLVDKYGPGYFEQQRNRRDESSFYRALGLTFQFSTDQLNRYASRIERTLQTVHQTLLEEIHGLADALEEPFERVLVYTIGYQSYHGCSHF